MYSKINSIKLGTIDTIKFHQERKLNLNKILTNLETKDIYLTKYTASDGNQIIKDEYSVARYSQLSSTFTLSSTSTIEIYGINQIYSNEAQTELIKHVNKSAVITKLDLPIDTHHPHHLTYVLMPQSNILEQRKDKSNQISYINGFTTTNLLIEIKKENSIIIKMLKRAFTNKSKLKKGQKNFYIETIYSDKGGYDTYTNTDDTSKATHLKIVFQEHQVFRRWLSKLKKNDFIVQYNSEDNLNLKANQKDYSIINYNKHQNIRTIEKHDDLLDEHYSKIIESITDDDEEHDELIDSIQWSRTELRFKFPSTDTTTTNTYANGQQHTIITKPKLSVFNPDGSLNERTFQTLSDTIKKRMEKIQIILFKSKEREKAFFKDYKIDPKKTIQFISNFGKIIRVEEQEVDKLIENLKSSFKI